VARATGHSSVPADKARRDVLRDLALHRRLVEVWRRRAIFEREDVDAMFGVLFDIRRELRAIRHLLEDDGEEEEEETKPDL
jgi:hypothetical protein